MIGLNLSKSNVDILLLVTAVALGMRMRLIKLRNTMSRRRDVCLAAILSLAVVTIQAKASESIKTNRSYLEPVKKCVDTLMAHGTDTYGDVQTPVLVSILDVESRVCPADPAKLDEAFRVTRRGRRSPAGSNLLTDQPTLKVMYALSTITGNKDYAAFADRYAGYVMKNLVDEQNFFWWGWHRHYDIFKDRWEGHNPNKAKWGKSVIPHEIHAITCIDWDALWAVNPEAVRKEIEAIWQWHVINKQTGEINRHGDGNKGCNFTMSAGAFIEAFVFLYTKTKDPVWLDRAKLLENHYWARRNPETNLFPERPNAGRKRFDGSCFVTSITGLYSHSLLKAYALTGESVFKDHAVAILKAYAEYGFDKETGKFWGALTMDGKHVPGPRQKGGYAQYEPRGHMDLWEPYVTGYQYPIYTAQAYVYAYELSKDAVLMKAAERFADWIKKTPPGSSESANAWYEEYSSGPGKKGTYAGKYGRTISFLLHLYVATGEKRYLDDARSMADTAIDKLYVNGLFRGHPAKPYYEAVDGVGYLLYALLELDQVMKDPKAVAARKAIVVGTGNKQTAMAMDNW